MMGHMFGSWNGGSWDTAPDYMKQMMQSYYGGMSGFLPYSGIIHVLTWLLLAALLIAAIRYLWNKGGKR